MAEKWMVCYHMGDGGESEENAVYTGAEVFIGSKDECETLYGTLVAEGEWAVLYLCQVAEIAQAAYTFEQFDINEEGCS